MDKKAVKAEALRRALDALCADRPEPEEEKDDSPAVCPHCGAELEAENDSEQDD